MREYFLDKITNKSVKTNNLTGLKFHKLLAIEFHHMKTLKNSSKSYWLFKCDCGEEVVRFSQLVKRGRVKSCGCSRNIRENSDVVRYNLKDKNMYRTYTSWSSMISRCYNSNSDSFEYYGGSGITVCESWQTFDNFIKDMGIRPENTSIDRIDVYKNYEPSNCKWSSTIEQANNRTATLYVTYEGETLSLKQCVDKHSKNRYDTVWRRIQSGWELHEALKLKADHANGFIKKCIDTMDDDELKIYMDK